MTRKMLTSAMVVVAMMLSLFSFGALTDSADAQGAPTCPYDLALRAVVAPNGCAEAIAYTGPFTNMPTAPGGPYGFGSLNPVADPAAAPAAPAAGGAGGGLAHTGSEAAVLGYVGTR